MENNLNTESSKAARKSKYTGIRSIVPYLLPYKKQIFFACMALVVTTFTVLSIPNIFKHLIDSGFQSKDMAKLDEFLAMLLGAVVLLAGGTYFRFYFINWAGEQVVSDIRKDVYAHILKLSPQFYESNRVGDIISRLTADVGYIQVVVGSGLVVALRNLLTMVGGLSMMFFTSAKLAAYILGVMPLVVIPIILMGKKVRVLSRQSQEKLSSLASHVEENIYGIKTVQAFGQQENEIAKFTVLSNDNLNTSRLRILKRAQLTAIVISLVFGSVSFVLWIGGKDVFYGNISYGDLSAFILYSVLVAGAFGAITEVMGDVQRASGAAERLMQILQTPSDIIEAGNPASLPATVQGNIEFAGVGFSYPSNKQTQIIKDFSLDIKAGQKVAIVGASGAGKTTVFELLLRFYDIDSGSIKIDGVSIRDLSLNDLRKTIAIVTQDPVIFSNTALENIKFGDSDASVESVKLAAEAAAALEFIEKLPDGFNTYLGEKGVRLSGGQKQRIAIARAILKNPKILLLDEATSALDSENERLVQEAIDNIAKNRTTLIIAHRLSTVKSADKIVVLDGGKIEAIGTHDELLKTSAVYQTLSQLQFKS